ncbi:hypothetical protein D3C78_1318820 [compost metagenome]
MSAAISARVFWITARADAWIFSVLKSARLRNWIACSLPPSVTLFRCRMMGMDLWVICSSPARCVDDPRSATPASISINTVMAMKAVLRRVEIFKLPIS